MAGMVDENYRSFDRWLQLKSEEFKRQGYESIQPKDLWAYLTAFRWKKNAPKRYYQQINDIMAIEPNDYFNYASLDAQIYSTPSLDEMDLDDLLK